MRKEVRNYLIVAGVSFSVAFLLSPFWGGRVLFWIGLIIGILCCFGIYGVTQPQGQSGGPAKETCLLCRREILPEPVVLGMQRMYLSQANFGAVATTEGMSGYACRGCGRKYCKSCLESKAPEHPAGGKACPSCGGGFAIMR